MYFIIILIALVAYAVILIAYPETRLWLIELIKKHPFLSGSLTCLVLVIITFLYFPLLFKSIAIEFWGIPKTVYQDGSVEVAELADLGPIGDIFGSLNSFISSIALCAVALSTWLQIKALKETREANQRQSELAEKNHQEQMKASDDAIFSNMFYNLLIHNKNTVNSLTITNYKGCLSKQDILELTSNELSRLLREDWKDNLDSITRVDAARALRKFISRISDGKTSTGFYSAFYNYKTLITLVKNHKNQELKESYFQIIANSMSYTEKKLLLWLSINGRNTEYLDCFKDTKILDLKLEPVVYDEKESKRAEERDLMLRFVKHFQIDPSSFKYHPDSANLKEETPA